MIGAVTWLLWGCCAVALLGAAHAGVNAALLRRPDPPPPGQPPPAGQPSSAGQPPVAGPVAVLVPARDEAHRIGPCLRSLLAQEQVPHLRITVLDDGSTDATAALVGAASAGDPRVRLLTGRRLPQGWLGKPHACQQLADGTDAEILIFVDADVTLAPHAVAAAVGLLRSARVDLLTPYPLIVAPGAQRLVQPLLQWSWLTFLPVRRMERSRRPALAAAGGQLLVVRRAAYLAAGGHAAVRDRVPEDVELARAVKRSGGRIAMADGSALASCRMYDSWADLVAGYTKSLWAAFGSPAGAVAVLAGLAAGYLVPPLAVLCWAVGAGRPAWALAGALGYGAGVAGRVIAAGATGGRALPDAAAHPISVALLGWLVVRSFALRGRVTWKGRPVLPGAPQEHGAPPPGREEGA